MTATFAKLSCIFVIAALVAGCDGSGTAGIGTRIPDTLAPIRPIPAVPAPDWSVASNIVAYGRATAPGGLWVNGVRYDTSRATFTIDGRLGTRAEINVGDVVLVVGKLDPNSTARRADNIIFDDAVEGPITSIDATDESLVALGQTVRTGTATSFADPIWTRSLAGLAVGDIIEVSGFRNDNGDILATRIEKQPLGKRDFETTGVVSNLDSADKRFSINALVVDYSATLMLQNFARGEIANGDVVEVKGSSLRSDGELPATIVELARNVSGNADDRVEIEGFISGLDVRLPHTFTIGGVWGVTNAATVFEPCPLLSLIQVEVEGSFDSNGTLVASEIRCDRSNPVRIAAVVDSASAATSSFVTLGITVKTDALTRMEDRSSARVHPFDVSDLVIGDYVELLGIDSPAASGEVLASFVERRDPETRTDLRGPVQRWVSGPQPGEEVRFRILGVTVTMNSATVARWGNGAITTYGAFWFELDWGTLIDVTGAQVGDREILATEVRGN
jgi:hypothetical protein